MMLSIKFAVCNSKKSRFIEEQKAKEVFGSLSKLLVALIAL